MGLAPAVLNRVTVARRVSSRYDPLYESGRLPAGARPPAWAERRAGIDVIVTGEGQELKLQSDAGQSPPRAGWIVVLCGGDAEAGFLWTLYGLPPGADPGR